MIERKWFDDKKIAVYTCNYGNYDIVINHVKQNIDCDYILFTDDLTQAPQQNSSSCIYKKIKYTPIDNYSKKHEVNPVNYNITNAILCRSDLNLLDPLKGYDICIYIDGNVTMVSETVIRNILSGVNENEYDMIIPRHPHRYCAYEEIKASYHSKYNNTDFVEQEKTLRSNNYPKNNGLYWNGFIVYLNPFGERMNHFYESYTHEATRYIYNKNRRYHIQGQVSLPFVLWKLNMKVLGIQSLYNNNGVAVHNHCYS